MTIGPGFPQVALGVGGVDKATVDDLTRTDALGGIFKKAFDLKAPQLDLGVFRADWPL